MTKKFWLLGSVLAITACAQEHESVGIVPEQDIKALVECLKLDLCNTSNPPDMSGRNMLHTATAAAGNGLTYTFFYSDRQRSLGITMGGADGNAIAFRDNNLDGKIDTFSRMFSSGEYSNSPIPKHDPHYPVAQQHYLRAMVVSRQVVPGTLPTAP